VTTLKYTFKQTPTGEDVRNAKPGSILAYNEDNCLLIIDAGYFYAININGADCPYSRFRSLESLTDSIIRNHGVPKEIGNIKDPQMNDFSFI
jgi:hypothetical protein